MAQFNDAVNGPWNDGGTWGNTSPGVEGTDWPGAGDNAVIDSNIVNLDSNRTCTGVVTSGSGTFNTSGADLFVDEGDFLILTGGVVNADTSRITMHNSTGSTNYDFSEDGGTFNADSGTLEFNVTAGTADLTLRKVNTLNNLEFTGTHYNFFIEDSFTTKGDLFFSSTYDHGTVGVQSTTTPVISAEGNVWKTSEVSALDPDITIHLTGTGTQTIVTSGNGDNRGLGALKICNTTNPIVLQSDLFIRGDLEIIPGAEMDANSAGNFTLQYNQSFINNGTFTAREGLVRSNNSENNLHDIIDGSTVNTFYDFEIGGDKFGSVINNDVTVLNDLTLSNTYNHDSGIQVDAARTISVGGDISRTGESGIPFDLTLDMNGTANQTISDTTSGIGADRGFGSLTISNTVGTVTALTDLDFRGAGAIDVDPSAEFNIDTYDLSRWDGSGTTAFTVDGTLAMSGDNIFTNVADPTLGAASTVKYNATSSTRDIKDYSYANLEFDGTGGTFTAGTSTATALDLIMTNGTFNTTASDWPLTVGNDYLQTGGSLALNDSVMTVAGDFNNTFNNGVVSGTSHVILTGTGTVQNVSDGGSPGFYDLTVAYPGQTTTITGNSRLRYSNDLHLGNGVTAGTFTSSGFKTLLSYKTTDGQITADSGYTFSVSEFRYENNTSASSFDFQTARVSVNSSFTVGQTGAITCAFLNLAPSNANSPIWNTNGFALTTTNTLNGINCGGHATSNATFNAGSSTITLNGSLGNAIRVGGTTSGSRFNANTASISCQGDILIRNDTAIFDFGSASISLLGDWNNSAGGSSASTSGLLSLVGIGTQTITSSGMAFNDVRVFNTSSHCASFVDPCKITRILTDAISGDVVMDFSDAGIHQVDKWDIDGIGTHRTIMKSTNPGSQWSVKSIVNRGLTKADITDSDLVGISLVVFGGDDGGNNDGWVFHGGGIRVDPDPYGNDFRVKPQPNIFRKNPVSL